jgi:hypothetical protein
MGPGAGGQGAAQTPSLRPRVVDGGRHCNRTARRRKQGRRTLDSVALGASACDPGGRISARSHLRPRAAWIDWRESRKWGAVFRVVTIRQEGTGVPSCATGTRGELSVPRPASAGVESQGGSASCEAPCRPGENGDRHWAAGPDRQYGARGGPEPVPVFASATPLVRPLGPGWSRQRATFTAFVVAASAFARPPISGWSLVGRIAFRFVFTAVREGSRARLLHSYGSDVSS